jgi:hypothetical protein
VLLLACTRTAAAAVECESESESETARARARQRERERDSESETARARARARETDRRGERRSCCAVLSLTLGNPRAHRLPPADLVDRNLGTQAHTAQQQQTGHRQREREFNAHCIHCTGQVMANPTQWGRTETMPLPTTVRWVAPGSADYDPPQGAQPVGVAVGALPAAAAAHLLQRA